MWRRLITITALIAGLLMLAQSVSFQTALARQGKEGRGQKLYLQYCASCHGTDGRGGGAVAPSLKAAVPDLTTIQQREGRFDAVRIQQYIAGEIGVTAHGQKDMPVWGYVFRFKQGQSTSTLNVYALMDYIRSIQQK